MLVATLIISEALRLLFQVTGRHLLSFFAIVPRAWVRVYVYG